MTEILDFVWLLFQGTTVVAAVALRGRKLGLAGVVGFGGSALLDFTSMIFGVAVPSLNSAIFMLAVPFLLGKRGTARQTIAATLAMLTTAYTSTVMGNSLSGSTFVELVGGSLVLLLAFVTGLVMRFRQTSKNHLISSLRSQERETLARDLHDTVAHRVSAIMVQAQAGQVLLQGNQTEGVRTALETIENEGGQALAEMREVVSTLRDSPGNSRWALAPLSDSSSFPPVRVVQTGNTESVSIEVSEVIYRIAQEAVTNARRHSIDASEVTVSLSCEPHTIILRVENDGAPVGNIDTEEEPADAGSGYGLVGMRERASTISASVSAGPQSDGGWLVELLIPRGNH